MSRGCSAPICGVQITCGDAECTGHADGTCGNPRWTSLTSAGSGFRFLYQSTIADVAIRIRIIIVVGDRHAPSGGFREGPRGLAQTLLCGGLETLAAACCPPNTRRALLVAAPANSSPIREPISDSDAPDNGKNPGAQQEATAHRYLRTLELCSLIYGGQRTHMMRPPLLHTHTYTSMFR